MDPQLAEVESGPLFVVESETKWQCPFPHEFMYDSIKFDKGLPLQQIDNFSNFWRRISQHDAQI